MKQCIVCQKDFENTTKKQKFCSNACRQKNFRKEVKEMVAEIRAKKAKIKPIEEVLVKEAVNYPKEYPKPEIKPQNGKPEPPTGLTGIDLAIWKSENWK